MTKVNKATHQVSHPEPPRVQFLKFLLVGLANTALSFAVYKLVLVVAPDGIPAATVAQALSYCAGICSSYLLNRGWVFAAAEGGTQVKSRFVLLQIALALGSTAAIGVTVDRFGLHATLTWLAVMSVVTILNFLLLRTWVFKSS